MRRLTKTLRALDGRQALRWMVAPAAAGLLLAGLTGAHAFARLVEASRPDFALAVWPSLPVAATAKADQLIATSQGGRNKAKLAQARQVALASLRREPLNPGALRTLASMERLSSPRAERLLTTSLVVSRRDAGTHLLEIEAKVAKGDIDGVLHHYDQALTVKPSMGPVLFPILLGATDDAGALTAIRKAVAHDPRWLPNLMNWSNANPDLLPALSRIVQAIPAASEALAPGYGQAAIESLVNKKQFDAAFRTYRAFQRQRTPQGFAGGFMYRPIDWAVQDNYDHGSQLVEQPRPFVRIYAEPTAKGTVLSRLVALPPGRHTLRLVLEPAQDSANAMLAIALSCAIGEERGFYEASTSARSRSAQAVFDVPQGCPYQWIRLNIQAGEQPVELNLRRVDLARAG